MNSNTLICVILLLAVFSTITLADVISSNFRGLCYFSSNCRGVCRGEGFVSGHCSYWGGACWCSA